MSENKIIIVQAEGKHIDSHDTGRSLPPISEVFKDVVGFETKYLKSKYCIRATIPAANREEFEKVAVARGYSVRDESHEERTAFKVPTGIPTRGLKPAGS